MRYILSVKFNWFTVVFYIIAGITVVVSTIISTTKDRLRRRAMRKLAADVGFTYASPRLPEALSLYGTPFAHCRSTSHVIDGQCNHMRVIVFDCSVGNDKNHYERTVIAARTGSNLLNADKFNPAMKADSSGPWTILYYPESTKHGLTSVEELQSHLAAI